MYTMMRLLLLIKIMTNKNAHYRVIEVRYQNNTMRRKYHNA